MEAFEGGVPGLFPVTLRQADRCFRHDPLEAELA